MIRRLARQALFPVRVARGRRAVAVLAGSGDRHERAIGVALDAVRRRRADADERAWVERIERLRQELEASREEISCTGDEFTGDPADRDDVLVERVGELCRLSSKPPIWAFFLFKLLREAAPERAVELGTCLGVSAAYQAAALRLAGDGKLATLDAARSRIELAERNLRSLDLDDVELVHGRFQETLEPTLARLAPVDYAFVDGHHDEHATLEYFERLKPRLAEPALVVFDDIAWSEGMARAWAAVRADPLVRLAVDLGNIGVCVVGGAAPKRDVRVTLDERDWRLV